MKKRVYQVREPIKSWPEHERPREIILEKGAAHVSDAGLIAILLRSGTTGKDAVNLARELLQKFGGLRGLLHADKKELEGVKGMGSAKIAQLMAALALTKRQLREGLEGKDYIENEQDVLDYLSLSMRDLKEEFFKIVYLDKANSILEVEDAAQGTVDRSSIYPRDVIKKALNINASALILVHNHPSGSLKPSRDDIDLTGKLIAACRSVGVTLLDHIIISPQGHTSLKGLELVSDYDG